MYYSSELEAEERKNERISAVATTVIMIILLLLSVLYTVYRNRVPPPGVKEYEVLGAIDFGDYKQGSRNINSFERAVENPSPPSKQESSKPVEEVQVTESAPPPAPPVVTPAPSPVTLPKPPEVKKPDPKPDPPKTTTPTPKPPKEVTPEPEKPKNDSQNNNSSSNSDDELLYEPSDNPSGSNQGQGGDVGNSGTPDVKVLDPDGLYDFGTGSTGGLKGRSPLALPKPKYDVQEEGILEFELTIKPDGTVAFVKAMPTNKLGLKKAGIDAIMNWRFTPVQGGGNQKVRVKINFKLKG